MSIFGNPDIPFKTRVSLLEERLSYYDEISKQMLSKLEQAVDKISESTRDISQILIRHEERIDRASEANTATIQLISKTESELKDRIEKTNEDLKEQVDTNSIAIEDLKRGKWIWVGIVMAVSFLVGQLRIIDHLNFPRQLSPNSRAEYVRTI